MKNIRTLIHSIQLITLLCLSFISYSQNFPIGVNLNLQAPHSPAYHTFTNDNFLQTNKINLSLFLKDMVVPSVDVGLQWEFRGPSGIYYSDPNLISLPINIQQGIPTLLSNNQLTPYLQSNNLPEVITNEDGFMAEGNWEVCVTAYELLNGEQVSATTCYYLFLEEFDPPEIIMPLDSMMPMYPQNVQLAWQPLHLGNFLVEYEVNLWEVIPEMTTQQIIESTFPYYSTKVDQVTSTFLTMADPPLTVGQEYLMQVRVSDKVNGEGRLPVYQFKNYGYSDVVRFKYGMFLEGAKCNTPSLPEYVLDDSLRSYILWDDGNPPIYQYEEDEPYQGGGGGSSSGGSGGALYHRMYYRPMEKEEEEWKHVDSEETWAQFTDYHRGQSYEIYVSNVCSAEERASESIVVDFPMLPPERDFSCGMPPLNLDLENRDPLPILMMGDTFMAGDFRVVLEEVSGGNGYFSGEGYFRSKFLKTVKVAVEFDDIFINSEYRMTEGFLETMYDPLDRIMFDMDEIMAGFEGNDEPFPVVHVGKLEDVKFENGVAILYPGGEEYEAPLRVITPEGEYLITGGEMLKKDEEFDPPNKIDEDYKVAFKAPVDMFYGYDAVDMSYPDHYKEVGGEKIPHKSVAYGGFDFLEMTIVKSKEVWQESDWDSISIRTHSQFEVKFEVEPGNRLKIKTPGLEEAEHIYVMYGKKCIGAFHLNSYMYTEFTVNLIPVNGVGSDLNIPELEKEVNKILGQGVAGVKLNLKTSQNITDGTTEIEADKYLMTAYSADMRRILNKHKDTYGQEDNELYLFLVNNLKDDVTGYMADGLNAGFIEVGGDVAHTIAHELGHGAFTLVHSWEEYDKGPEGNSDNLMDYFGKDRLRVKQWNRMHDQKLPRPWVRGSEDQSAYVTEGYFNKLEFGMNTDSTFSFVTPAGGYVVLPNNVKNVTKFYGFDYGPMNQPEEFQKFLSIPPGTLRAFEIDQQVFEARIDQTSEGYEFMGYYSAGLEYIPENFEIELDENIQSDTLIFSAFTFSNNSANYSLYRLDGKILNVGSQILKDINSFPIQNPENEHFGKKTLNIDYTNNNAQGINFETLNWGMNDQTFQSNENTQLIINKFLELKGLYPRLIGEEITSNFGKWSANNVCHVSNLGSTFENALLNKFCELTTNEAEVYEYKNELDFPPRRALYFELLEHVKIGIGEKEKELSELYEKLKNYNYSEDIIQDLELSVINNLVNFVSNEDLQYLDTEVILRLVSKIASKFRIYESSNYAIRDSEGSILKLFRNINSQDYCEVYKALEKPSFYNIDQILIYELFKKVDDQVFFFGGDNRKEIIIFFSNVFMNCEEAYYSKLAQAYAEFEKRVFLFDYDSFIKRTIVQILNNSTYYLLELSDVFSDNISINTFDHKFIDLDAAENAGKIKIQPITQTGFINTPSLLPSYFDPFDLVFMVSNTSLRNVSDLAPRNSDELDVRDFPLPAITLAYASQSASNQTTQEAIETIIDIGSLAISGGALSTLSTLSKARRILYTADVISSLSGIGATALSSNPEFNEISNVLSLISLGTGVISATDVLIQSKKLVEAGTNIETELSKITNSVNRMSKAEVGQLAVLLERNTDNPEIIRKLYLEQIKRAKETNDQVLLAEALDQFNRFHQLSIAGRSGEGLIDDIVDLSGEFQEFITSAKAASQSNYLDVIVHGNGTDFIINGNQVNHRTLAKYLESQSSPKPIRLLSCANEQSAIDLSNKLGRDVFAYDGITRIYNNGKVGGFTTSGSKANAYQYSPGGGRKIAQFDDEVTDGFKSYLELGANPRIISLIDNLPTDLVSSLKQFGFADEDIGFIFNTLGSDVRKLENFANTLSASTSEISNFTELVADLKKSEAKDLLKYLGDVEEGDGVKVLKGFDILKRAGRSVLKYNIQYLQKLMRCIDHPELLKLGIDEDFLIDIGKALQGDFSQAGSLIEIDGVESLLTTSRAKILEDEIFDEMANLGDFLIDNKPKDFGNFIDIVIPRLKGIKYSQRKGAIGVFKFLQESSTKTKGGEFLFEVTVANSRGTNSFIDVIVNGLRFEVKYCTDCITAKTIREQLIERDIFNAKSIEDMTKWKVYDQIYTKDHLITHLKSNKDAIEKFETNKIQSFFSEFDELDGITDQNIQDFVNAYYDIIFN